MPIPREPWRVIVSRIVSQTTSTVASLPAISSPARPVDRRLRVSGSLITDQEHHAAAPWRMPVLTVDRVVRL